MFGISSNPTPAISILFFSQPTISLNRSAWVYPTANHVEAHKSILGTVRATTISIPHPFWFGLGIPCWVLGLGLGIPLGLGVVGLVCSPMFFSSLRGWSHSLHKLLGRTPAATVSPCIRNECLASRMSYALTSRQGYITFPNNTKRISIL